MDRLKLVPIFLLFGSLVVLLGLFVGKAVSTRQQAEALIQTQTAYAEQITTAVPPTDTIEPTATAIFTLTPELPTATVTEFPTETPKPGEIIPEGCLEATYVADVTIPDKTEIFADHKFTKTWRLMNTGTCTWTPGYKLYFVSGNQMAGPDKQQAFAVDVEPGQVIEISVELRASKSLGERKGFWGLKDQYGNEFGLGKLGDPFYVEIVVVE